MGGAPRDKYAVPVDSALRLWLLARDPDLRRRWKRWLSSAGWSVIDLPQTPSHPPPLRGVAGPALLDAALLEESDLSEMRKRLPSPLILFGGGEQATEDKVARFLMAGADDFISASIQERVLLAKLMAYARRLWPEAAGVGPVRWSPLRRIKADSRRKLAWVRADRGWEPLKSLTGMELRLLLLFLEHAEAPMDRAYILEKLWGERAADINPITLNKHIESLRRKLGPHGRAIRTLYGFGYMFLEEK